MAKVIKIAISQNSKGQMGQMKEANSVEAVAGKGLVNDRYFEDNNEKRCQITLIQIENIDNYNKIYGTKIPAINFRRNIVTQDIKLNELLEKIFFIGEVKVIAHDLCRPCKYLQESLKQEHIIKEFVKKGGLRCEILNNGKIYVGDGIKY